MYQILFQNSEDANVRKNRHNLCSHEIYSQVEKMDVNQITESKKKKT
jgi:hypothetical protein